PVVDLVLVFVAVLRPSRSPPSFPTRRSSDLSGRRLRPPVSPAGGGTGMPDASGLLRGGGAWHSGSRWPGRWSARDPRAPSPWVPDRKSTRLNSSHVSISYAVFCLKKNRQPSN